MTPADRRESSTPAQPPEHPNLVHHHPGAHIQAPTGSRHHLTANLFGIPLGLAGLSQCWTIAHDLSAAPAWPANALWVITSAVWLFITSVYYAQNHRPTDLARELADPTLGPFVAVSVIVPMMLGGALARYLPTTGHIVFYVALALTLLAGGWLSGQWILSDTALAQWHPGYFLPTVGGGFIAAIVSAGFAARELTQLLFGYGFVCWIVLGSIILTRLFTQPALPVPLRPTLAIEMAPPVVAGLAWFAINGRQVDPIALGLAGYAFLMAMVQIRLIPFYRTVPFGPGWWAYSFPFAAATAYAIEWFAAENAAAGSGWTWVLLAVVTIGAVVFVGRTIAALIGDRFLPRLPPPAARGQASQPSPPIEYPAAHPRPAPDLS